MDRMDRVRAMVLESLLELVETLSKRIDEHGAALRQSEALTRYALIDPLLRELGWDTANPALVIPEHRLGAGVADYALVSDGKPMVVVEAKKLDENLHNAASQGITYCISDGIRFFSVTDGRRWEIYETHLPVPIDGKRIVSLDLRGTPATEVCLKAMALWQPSVQQGNVMAAEKPIVGLDAIGQTATADAADNPNATSQQATTYAPVSVQQTQLATHLSPVSVPNAIEQEWISVSEYSPAKEDKAPYELRFPDGSTTKIQRWFMLLTETVRWLYNNRYITESNLRIQDTRNLIVSDSPFHPGGRPFSQSKTIGPLHVETHGHRWTLVRKIRTLITRTGLASSQFKVRIATTYEPASAPRTRPPAHSAPTSVPNTGEQEWIPLSDLNPKGRDPSPVEIQFPDNSKVALGRWNLVMVETARWLYRNSYLNARNWRIRRGTRYIVSNTAIHADGKEFHSPAAILGSLYVEKNYSALNSVKNARTVIERAGQDPAQFKVRLR